MGSTKRKAYVTAAAGHLARLRVKRGLFVPDAARAAGLRPGYLYNLEAGTSRAGDDALKALARLYRVPEAEVRAAHRTDLRKNWLKHAAA